MSYNIIPNIIFVIALVGVILIILRHLPAATAEETVGKELVASEQRLMEKGLPVLWASKFKTWIVFWGQRGWHFVLEAKGIKHQAHVGYRIKKIFHKNTASRPVFKPVEHSMDSVMPVLVKDEAYFLAEIKQNPKSLENYSGLALLYTQAKNFEEARDIYEYLVKHDSGNADYHARLGYAHYLLDNFEKAIESYKKSLALDSAHPSRFYNLGLSQKAFGDEKGAAVAFKKALGLEPKNRNYQEALEELNT